MEQGPNVGWGHLAKRPEAVLAATMSPDVGWGRLAKQPEQFLAATILVGAYDYLDQLPDSACSDGTVCTFHSDEDGVDLLLLSLDDTPPSAGPLLSRARRRPFPFACKLRSSFVLNTKVPSLSPLLWTEFSTSDPHSSWRIV
jgi:hypothetical protein